MIILDCVTDNHRISISIDINTHRYQQLHRERCSGVVCDRRMPVKLNGKVYKTVVRPALLYGAETWATMRGQEARLEVNEMKTLTWMCGVTRREKIRNEQIRGTTRVVH